MSAPFTELTGTEIEDYLHRISRALTDKDLTDPFFFYPFLLLTKNIDPTRKFYIVDHAPAAGVATMNVRASAGKRWIVTGLIYFTADAGVANRVCKCTRTKLGVSGKIFDSPIAETVTASSSSIWSLGRSKPADNVNASITVFLPEAFELWTTRKGKDGVELWVSATNIEAGDQWTMDLLIEEHQLYDP